MRKSPNGLNGASLIEQRSLMQARKGILRLWWCRWFLHLHFFILINFISFQFFFSLKNAALALRIQLFYCFQARLGLILRDASRCRVWPLRNPGTDTPAPRSSESVLSSWRISRSASHQRGMLFQLRCSGGLY